MKKELFIIGTLAILLSVGFSGCNQENNKIDSEKDRFIGTWQTSPGYPSLIEFFKDGGLVYGAEGTWDLKDGKLVIIIPSYNLNDTYNYEFSNNDNTLTMTLILNNYSQVWTKQ